MPGLITLDGFIENAHEHANTVIDLEFCMVWNAAFAEFPQVVEKFRVKLAGERASNGFGFEIQNSVIDCF